LQPLRPVSAGQVTNRGAHAQHADAHHEHQQLFFTKGYAKQREAQAA